MDRTAIDLSAAFEAAFTLIGGKFHRARGLAYAGQQIGLIAANLKARSAVLWDTPLLRDADLEPSLTSHGCAPFWANDAHRGDLRQKLIVADLGITGADYALADTGTLVMLARPGQPRAASLLPPRHIAMLQPENLVSDLEELFAKLRARGPNLADTLTSAMTFITGPSRTADIEQTLFQGVHGPLEVHVVFVETE